MAGSIKWQIYTDDQGNQFGVRLDESNGEATGFADYTGEAILPLPRGWKMRYINAVDAEGGTRQIPVGTVDHPLFTGAEYTVTILGRLYEVTSTRGEQKVLPRARDTGLLDGDVS